MTPAPDQPRTASPAPGAGFGVSRRPTKRRVRIVDAAARAAITSGGIAIIVAVCAIMLYLVVTVLPLLRQGHVTGDLVSAPQAALLAPGQRPHHLELDEYAGSLIVLTGDGSAKVVKAATGEPLGTFSIAPAGRTITAISEVTETGLFAVGLDDGSVATGRIGFVTSFLPAEQVPQSVREALRVPGDRAELPAEGDGPKGYVELTAKGQYRSTRAVSELGAPVPLPEGSGPVRLIDFRSTDTQRLLVAVRDDGTAAFSTVSVTRPLGGGTPRTRLSSEPFNYAPPASVAKTPPLRMFLTSDGASVFALWPNGLLQRYARAKGDAGFVAADTLAVTPPGRTVTRAAMLLGAKTLIVGDDQGDVYGIFAARQEAVDTPDRLRAVVAHTFPGGGSPIAAITISKRDRSFATVDAAGLVTVRNMTSHKTVVELATGFDQPTALLGMNLGVDGELVAVSASGALAGWSFEPFHPEASLKSLFGRVWYEGAGSPDFVYQSSSGEDTAEIKLSLMPLIFGTLKATTYALLFAVPIAILAAIYTSEMLHPKVRNSVKPVIEMMASLPSVVLGFVAAMVIAPLARDLLPSVLLAFMVVPVAGVLAACLWQMLPIRLTAGVSSMAHLALVLGVVLVAGAVALPAGRLAERVLFTPSTSDVLVLAGSTEVVPREQWPAQVRDLAELTSDQARPLRALGLYERSGVLVRPVGSLSDPAVAAVVQRDGLDRANLRLWLDGVVGGPWSGWFVIMMPAGFVLTVLLRSSLLDPLLGALPFYSRRSAAALAELVKFLCTCLAAIGVTALLAWLLTGMGIDVRDSVLGSFNQRNTLVVGIVMGFAVIPIIYTISEDAMSAVPGQLRSASLGCGATRWQTATRVVLPLALSGIFSACMIGLGRAAGETMIVLMATGNTPEMEWNLFSGFRTLSANIAVEMPEAVEGSTHYRVLFLGGLCLFVMTFCVNTLAEVVRQRVRKRGASL